MLRQDILLDTDFNPLCANGDFVCGDSDEQHVELILISAKNTCKESPMVGAGLVSYLKSKDTSIDKMKREIRVQIEGDGYKYNSFDIDKEGNYALDYEPNY